MVSLIHKFLKAPVSENGKVSRKTTIGTPQGGPVSPILANIILNELDQMLDSEGIRFSRYADDMVIMCRSRYAAERVLKKVTKFVEEKLFLKVNQEKTKIGKASPEMKFLGFGFTRDIPKTEWAFRADYKGWTSVIHSKSVTKFKKSVKEILDRKAPGGVNAVAEKLKLKLRGWVNYFEGSIPYNILKILDG